MSRVAGLGVLALCGCDVVFLGRRPIVTEVDARVCPDSHDEDQDSVLDCRDNCPGIGNSDQPDGDRDGVGDACDPNPDAPGDPDAILIFEPFANVDALVAWTRIGSRGAWTVESDQLHQMDDFADPFLGLLLPEPNVLPATLETRMTIVTDGGALFESFHFAISGADTMRQWPHCALAPITTPSAGDLTAFTSYRESRAPSAALAIVPGDRYQIQLIQLDNTLRCTVDRVGTSERATVTSPLPVATMGGVYLGTHNMRVRIDYVAVYGRRR